MTASEARVVHLARGRVRVHWPQGWAAGEPDVWRLLESIGGARAVRANSLTQNVLVQFDERVTDGRRVAAKLEQLAPARRRAPAKPPRAKRAAQAVARP